MTRTFSKVYGLGGARIGWMYAPAHIVDAINRLAKEGIDNRVIMAGLGAATADLVCSAYGMAAVAAWFESQAQIARGMSH